MANLLTILSVDTLHSFLRISTILLAALFVVLALNAGAFGRRGTLPPGPKPLPLIGNLLDIPLSEEWLTWSKHVNRYGDLVYFTALGRNYLLLGSYEAINDLLDKRAHFNDRPHLTMLSELMGVGWGLLLLPYGDRWRRGRKVMHSQMNIKAAEGYRDIQVRKARRFVGDLLASENQRPADRLSDDAKAVLPHMVRYNFAYTILDMVYGIDVQTFEMEADYVEPTERFMHRFSQGSTPGQFLVDYIPLLKHVPSWVPGAGFQCIARETRVLSEKVLEVPMQHMKSHMEANSSRVTMAAEMLKAYPHDERLVKEMAATVYLAGSDTTVSAVTSFFLAMVVYPEVQKRAQEELERVVGCDRFPDFSDKARLPYLEGVIRECLRWLPVVPVAPGHVTTQDDEYRGYFIPKGTVALPFQWGLLHDADTYPEPSLFSPERYLTRQSDGTWSIREDVQDPRKFIFGFGRRVCPGSHIAEQALFAILTTVLQTLDVVRVKDHDGHEVIPEARMSSGLLCHPIPFAYALCARKDTRNLVDMCNAAAGHH